MAANCIGSFRPIDLALSIKSYLVESSLTRRFNLLPWKPPLHNRER